MKKSENQKLFCSYANNPDINPDILAKTPIINGINPDMNPDMITVP